MRALRRTIDVGMMMVRRLVDNREQALHVLSQVRAQVIELFPDKGDVFDLVCAPRLRRAIDERFPPPS